MAANGPTSLSPTAASTSLFNATRRVQQLEESLQLARQTIEALQQAGAQAQGAGSANGLGGQGGTSERILDTRVLGKPDTFDGVEKNWPDWSVVIKAFSTLNNGDIGKLMDFAEEHSEIEILNGVLPANLEKASIQLYYVLLMNVKSTTTEHCGECR